MFLTDIMCSNFLNVCLTYIIVYWFVYFLTCLGCLIILSYVFVNNRIGLYCLQSVKYFSLFHTCMVISFLSLAGFPPFVGFWTKLTLAVFVSHSSSSFFLVMFWSLLLLSLLFYLRVLRYFYAWSAESSDFSATVAASHVNVLVWLLFFICCGGFLINDLLLIITASLL